MSDVNNQGQGQQPTEVDFVALQPGQAIGRYEIVAILGQGGFGITYRARDAQLNREVAIKEYLPSALAVRQDGSTVLPRSTKVADDFTWGRQRFVDEGRTLATLQRAPAIVRVFDFLEANGTAYIVMELVPGDTLENRLKAGKLSPAEVERILWPLLEGLEQVHATGFLHRDIKPANILLDGDGNPTLIDFGASRAAMAGRTAAMTAIFTPGYAAAEQMTSAKQGPWTDIYGVSATLYHAITGAPPPSAFDRMLDDAYEPLGKLLPAGFAPGLLVGIDAGLAVRATDRPQAIAGWRPILGQAGAADAQATVVLGRTADPGVTVVVRAPAAAPPTAAAPARRGMGLWVGAAAAVLLLAGGGYYFATKPAALDPTVVEAARKQQEAVEAEAVKRKAADEELAKLRAEAAVRQKAEQEAALRQKVEEETRQKVAAEQAEKRRLDDEARQKAEEDRQRAEAAEAALRHSILNRQHIQVALTSLGFNTNAADGVLAGRSREMIVAWQKARNYPPTGFLNGLQYQALMREGAPAIAKFDEDQKKTEEARKKAEEERAKAEAAAGRANVPTAPAAAAPPSANQPNVASIAPKPGAAVGTDGSWRGTYHCMPSRGGGEFTMAVNIHVTGGVGTWQRRGQGRGNHSLTMRFSGQQVIFQRVYTPMGQEGTFSTATLTARFDGTTITGGGTEQNSGGRTCDVSFSR